MERLLGALEHSFWLYDQIHPLHFSLCAKILGKFTIAQLERSLAQVQQQHPLLRTRIALTPTGQPKFVEHHAEIPVRVVEKVEDQIDQQQWQQALEEELSASFNWAIAPLVRVVWLQSAQHPESSELIVTFHHSIADGLSGVYLLRDIVTGIDTQTSGTQTLVQHPPIESLLPDQFRPKRISKEPLLDSEPIPTQSSGSCSTRRTPHVRTALLSLPLTQQLSDRCRAEQTTIHGAISAAFLLTLARQAAATEVPLQCLSPINVRSQLTPAVEQSVGLYITYGLTHHPLTADSLFWDIARSQTAQLAKARFPQKLLENFSPRQAAMENCPTALNVVQGMQQQYSFDLLVTNLGRVEIEPQAGTLQIEALYGPAVMTGVANERVVGVVTLGDRLSLTAVFPATSISAITATQTLEEGLSVLHHAVNDSLGNTLRRPFLPFRSQAVV